MKLIFKHELLHRAVRSLKSCVGGSDFVEAENLLFRVSSNNKVKIMTTDTVNFSVRFVKCQVFRKRAKGGDFFINYNILSQYLDLWSEDVSLSISAKGVIITSGKDKLKLPQLQGMEEFLDKFPEMLVSKKSIACKELHTYVSLCSMVSPKEHAQPVVTGVHISVNDGNLVVESTDGFRLLRFEKLVKQGYNLDVVIYKTGCQLLSDLQQAGKFWIRDNFFYFRSVDGLYAIGTLGGQYPDVSPLIPVGGDKVQFGVSVLKNLLRKAGIMGCNNIVMDASTKKLEARSIDSKSVFKANLDVQGKLPLISLDIGHLLFVLSLTSEEVITLYFSGSHLPMKYVDVLESGADITSITMPYHIN